MRSLNFFDLPIPSSCTMATGFTQPLTEKSTRKCFWGVKNSRYITLTSQQSVCCLSINCEILDISQSYRPPWPVMGIALPSFTLYVLYKIQSCICNTLQIIVFLLWPKTAIFITKKNSTIVFAFDY
jgi:hypothetical protein